MDFRKRFEMIRGALEIFMQRGSVAELRVPASDRGPQRGIFTDLDAMAKAAATLSGTVPGVYFTINSLKQSAKRGAKNSVRPSATAVKDDDVSYRDWLLLDFDPIRPSKLPATDGEHEAALMAARGCRAILRRLGWPDPVLADSGNGAHLLYRILLANDEENYLLLKNVLAALALRFSNSKVTLDRATVNASYLVRVYGTKNCKGESTEERPHRRSQLLEEPERVRFVNKELLVRVAETLPSMPTGQVGKPVDIDRWLRANQLPVLFDAPWDGGGHRWILRQCPWKQSHKNTAFILQFSNGGIAAGCLHNSCRTRSWQEWYGNSGDEVK